MKKVTSCILASYSQRKKKGASKVTISVWADKMRKKQGSIEFELQKLTHDMGMLRSFSFQTEYALLV
jgi:hypothetical protein